MNRTFVLVPVLVGLVASSGCASLNKKERGAIIGGATGAAVGGIVGRANGSTAKGAIIGAAVGGAAGAVIGHQMDQQAKEIQQNIPGAVVERVGEGLQVTFESGLLFDYDSDVLRAPAKQNLSSMAASLELSPTPRVLSRQTLFSLGDLVSAEPHANFDVAADGRFVMVRRPQTPRLVLIQNVDRLVAAGAE